MGQLLKEEFFSEKMLSYKSGPIWRRRLLLQKRRT